MDQDLQANSVERRRKVLKGALAASSVLTMGYSGAALASITCVEKGFAGKSFPAGTAQFVRGGNSPPSTVAHWTWLQVEVSSYQVGRGASFEGFKVNGNVYAVKVPNARVVNAVPAGNQRGYPTPGWVLVYFDKDGNTVGSYPSPVSEANDQNMPATGSCVTSLAVSAQKTMYGG
jgi:hypothetical protein